MMIHPDRRFAQGARTIALSLALAALSACGGADSAADGSNAAVSAGGDAAGQPYPGGEAGTEAQRQQVEIYMELQTIDQQLGPIRDRAIAEPDLAERQQSLVTRMEAAMEAASPGILDKRARFDSLVAVYQGSQPGGDAAELQAMESELQGLQLDLGQAQQEALAGPELRDEMEGFREALFARMREMDATADSLFRRGDELNARLDSLIGGGG